MEPGDSLKRKLCPFFLYSLNQNIRGKVNNGENKKANSFNFKIHIRSGACTIKFITAVILDVSL
jgi:hypothetical protein